jgi:putative hydrolase of the HAD superfamily
MVSVDHLKQQELHHITVPSQPEVRQPAGDRALILHVNQIIDRHQIKAVIFDVDGTLYSLKKLYDRMHWELFKYYLSHPTKILDIWILHNFIQARERNTSVLALDLETAQYEWAVHASRMPLVRVQQVVQRWIFDTPLNYLYDCRYPEMIELFLGLVDRGIPTAIFSDYPSQAKLACLGLSPQCIVSSTDKGVNRLKPNPKGLQAVVDKLGMGIQDCLFIGDRDDRDGECARRLGMHYLILASRTSQLKWADNPSDALRVI